MEPNFLGGVCPFPSIQAGEQRKPPGMADPGRLSFPFPLIPSPPSLLSYLNLSQTSLTELIQSPVSQSYMQQFGHLFHQAKQLFHHDPSADLIGEMANTEREREATELSLSSLFLPDGRRDGRSNPPINPAAYRHPFSTRPHSVRLIHPGKPAGIGREREKRAKRGRERE